LAQLAGTPLVAFSNDRLLRLHAAKYTRVSCRLKGRIETRGGIRDILNFLSGRRGRSGAKRPEAWRPFETAIRYTPPAISS
jgi:hypothetical protein